MLCGENVAFQEHVKQTKKKCTDKNCKEIYVLYISIYIFDLYGYFFKTCKNLRSSNWNNAAFNSIVASALKCE